VRAWRTTDPFRGSADHRRQREHRENNDTDSRNHREGGLALLQITISDLQTIMSKCAGEAEDGLPLEQAPDRPFDELGYDSIALLETYSRIERDYGVELCDDSVCMITTAGDLVELVNSLLQLKVMSAV
jgi:act minimal PKS acyl carrier protein